MEVERRCQGDRAYPTGESWSSARGLGPIPEAVLGCTPMEKSGTGPAKTSWMHGITATSSIYGGGSPPSPAILSPIT
eukprot:353199-Chlamydomonas_euryale.AAC.5